MMENPNQQNLGITHTPRPSQPENQRKKKQKEKKLDEDIKALKKELEKQQGHLTQLLSNGFQLANYYFVFQGVILTTLCNRSTILKCSDRWFLATLSALAATVNLFALVSNGIKYNRIFSEHAKIWTKCNELQVEKETLKTPNSKTPTDPPSGQKVLHVDDCETKILWVILFLSMIFFLSFAIIVFVGSLKFLCRDRAEPKN
ncbi:uncharacterized protein LOC123914978 [Trifolium pratense]|uniref:uncharacterized protein LOC123914978 n=1 Tax=Trifolium pratense TaxID=57577 RepID=UPI001E694259|nr:uncharacterized protein LOC123914978 [Trifolium pratense]